MLSSSLRQHFSPVTAVFLIVLVDVLGFTIILPLLPFYAERFGASPMLIGALLAAYAACQLISGPIFGRWSDTIGRKPLLLVSQVGTCLSFILLAFAPNMTWVFLARILDGVTAGNISLAQAAISDVTAPHERGKAFGKVGVAFGVGFLIGPALSGFLSRFGYAVPILTGAALSGLSILATILLLPADRTKTAKAQSGAPIKLIDLKQYAGFFNVPGLRLRLVQLFTFILAFSMYTSGIALFAGRRLEINGKMFGPSDVAYILAYGGLLGILIQGFMMGRLIKRFGELTLVKFGFIALAIGMLVLSIANGLIVALLAATFTALGHGTLRPILNSLVSQSVGPQEQGAVLGLSQSLQSMAQILAPLIGGWLIEQRVESVWALAAALFAVFGLVVPWRHQQARAGTT
jgi:MFS family permease